MQKIYGFFFITFELFTFFLKKVVHEYYCVLQDFNFFSRDEYFLTISDILTTVELVFCKYVYTFILQESYYYVQK